MNDGLSSMPGHRMVPTAETQDSSALLDLFPFLPADFDAAMPLYMTMALLFVLISRAARRKRKVRLRKRRTTARTAAAAAAARSRALGANPTMRPHDGYWGDGVGSAQS